MPYVIPTSGFQPKTAQIILDELLRAVGGGLGVTLDTSAESTVVRLLSTYADTLAGAWETANQLWLAGDPGQAADLALDDLVAAVGLRRLFATPSKVDAICIGRAGTTLPAGQIVSADGARFGSINEATLEASLWYGRVEIKRVVGFASYGASAGGAPVSVSAATGQSASDLAVSLAAAWKSAFTGLIVEARGDGVDIWARQTGVTPAFVPQVTARQRLNVILGDLVPTTWVTIKVKSGNTVIATASDMAGSASTPAVFGTVIANLAGRLSGAALRARPGADGRSIDIEANTLGTAWTVDLGSPVLSFSDQTPTGLARLETKLVGGATVRFESVETGPVPALANHLTRIETPLSGWDRVTNTASADLGRDQETDRALRGRLARSRYILATGVAGAIEARLRQDITGLRAVSVIENDADTADAAGRPAHSFEVVVDAIDDDATNLAIGKLIESLRPVSVPAVSTAIPATANRVEARWQDDSGTTRSVVFSRPVPVPIYLKIRLLAHPDEVFPAGAEDILKDRILLWGQAHSIGQDVVIGRMYALLHAFAGIGPIGFVVAGRSRTAVPGNIAIGPLEIARFDPANVTLHPPV